MKSDSDLMCNYKGFSIKTFNKCSKAMMRKKIDPYHHFKGRIHMETIGNQSEQRVFQMFELCNS